MSKETPEYRRGYAAALLFATKALQAQHAQIGPGFMRASTCGRMLLAVGRVVNAEANANYEAATRGKPE